MYVHILTVSIPFSDDFIQAVTKSTYDNSFIANIANINGTPNIQITNVFYKNLPSKI